VANKSEISIYEKIREVYSFMISASKQRADIIQFFSDKWTKEKYFDTDNEKSKERTIDNYIKKVKDTFLNFENEVETEKGRTLARLDDLYSKMIKIQDYKGALSVIREIREIVGLGAITKTETTIKQEKPLIINIDGKELDL